MVFGLIQRPAGAHDRQRVERVADQVPHDGARDRAREEDSHVDGPPYRAYVFSGQPGADQALAEIIEVSPSEGFG
jgi:hypothetical protein